MEAGPCGQSDEHIEVKQCFAPLPLSVVRLPYVQSPLPVVKARSAVKKADPMGSVLNTVDHTQVSSNRSQTEDRSKWKMDKSPFMAYLEAIEAVL